MPNDAGHLTQFPDLFRGPIGVKVVCIPGKIKDFFVLLHIKKPKIMKFTRLTAFVCVLAVSSLSYAQQVPQAPYVKEIKKLPHRCKKWNVPAMALTVVKDGETIYAEGLGTLRAEKDLPVPTNTHCLSMRPPVKPLPPL